MPEESYGVLSLAFKNSMSVTYPSLAATPGALALAREVLQIEAQAISALIDRIDSAFSRAVDLLLACSGRVVVSGVGRRAHRTQDCGNPGVDRHPIDVCACSRGGARRSRNDHTRRRAAGIVVLGRRR